MPLHAFQPGTCLAHPDSITGIVHQPRPENPIGFCYKEFFFRRHSSSAVVLFATAWRTAGPPDRQRSMSWPSTIEFGGWQCQLTPSRCCHRFSKKKSHFLPAAIPFGPATRKCRFPQWSSKISSLVTQFAIVRFLHAKLTPVKLIIPPGSLPA